MAKKSTLATAPEGEDSPNKRGEMTEQRCFAGFIAARLPSHAR